MENKKLQLKKCLKCKECLDLSSFYRHPTNKDRYQSYCKQCYKSYLSIYHLGETGRIRRKVTHVNYSKKIKDWNNYGSYWHIDHIIPVSLFKFKTVKDSDFKKCWSLSNLQPLERLANCAKGNKILIPNINK